MAYHMILLEELDEKITHLQTDIDLIETKLTNLTNSFNNAIVDDKITHLQTDIDSIETKLTNLTNSFNNIMIDKAAAAGDHQHADFNYGRTVFRLPKINFPRFDGQNPRAWTLKCEQFFELCPVPETHKVLFASFYLDGRPEIWFRSYYEMKGKGLEWPIFVHDICASFGCCRIELREEFRSLQQTNTVVEYLEKFEEIMADVIWEFGFDDKFLVASFIWGLNDEIRFSVQRFNPTSVSDAARLARLQEAALKPITG